MKMIWVVLLTFVGIESTTAGMLNVNHVKWALEVIDSEQNFNQPSILRPKFYFTICQYINKSSSHSRSIAHFNLFN